MQIESLSKHLLWCGFLRFQLFLGVSHVVGWFLFVISPSFYGCIAKFIHSSVGGHLDPWVRKMPWMRKWQPTSVFLPGESHGQRSLGDCSPQGCKESDTPEPLSPQVETFRWRQDFGYWKRPWTLMLVLYTLMLSFLLGKYIKVEWLSIN